MWRSWWWALAALSLISTVITPVSAPAVEAHPPPPHESPPSVRQLVISAVADCGHREPQPTPPVAADAAARDPPCVQATAVYSPQLVQDEVNVQPHPTIGGQVIIVGNLEARSTKDRPRLMQPAEPSPTTHNIWPPDHPTLRLPWDDSASPRTNLPDRQRGSDWNHCYHLRPGKISDWGRASGVRATADAKAAVFHSRLTLNEVNVAPRVPRV